MNMHVNVTLAFFLAWSSALAQNNPPPAPPATISAPSSLSEDEIRELIRQTA
jgi:hypothetical protein